MAPASGRQGQPALTRRSELPELSDRRTHEFTDNPARIIADSENSSHGYLRLTQRAHGETVHRNAPCVVLTEDGRAPGSVNQLGCLFRARDIVSLARSNPAGSRTGLNASYSMGWICLANWIHGISSSSRRLEGPSGRKRGCLRDQHIER